MHTRSATKRELRKLNQKAIKAERNSLTDAFFEQLRGDLRYLVWQACHCERGWSRYFVGFSPSSSPIGDDFQTVVLDIRDSEFDKLPSVEDVVSRQPA